MHIGIREFFYSKKHSFIVGGLGLAIGIVGILLFLKIGNGGSAAGWFDDNWQYRKRITATNNTTAETDVYVTISNLDTSDTTRFQGDCGDIRFASELGEILPYYVSSGCGTATTTIQIQFSTFIAGPQDIYLYYGSPYVVNGGESATFSTAATNATVGSPASEEQTPGPIAALSLDEGYGTTTYDSTTYGNDGTITNAVWKTESNCISGNCMYFDGTGDYVSIADSNSLDNASAISVAAWFKPNLVNSTRQDIVTKAGSFEFRIHTDNTFRVKLFGLSDDFLSGTMPALVADQWVHIVATYDGANIKAYVNGSLVLTDDSTGNITTTTTAMILGSETASTYPFKGYIDEVRVYPYARTASEIRNDFAARGSVSGVSAQIGAGGPVDQLSNGLVAYYPMDESAANSCTGGVNDTCDRSGNGNDGAWNGNATTTIGKFGSGTAYDGTDDYTQINETTSLDFDKSKGTVSMWVKATDFSNGLQQILLDTSGDSIIFALQADGDLYFYPNATIGPYYNLVTSPLIDSQWNHIVATWDLPTKSVKIFVNGIEKTLAENLVSANWTSAASTTNFYLGSRYNQTANQFFAGSIDETRIYNRALSPAEVRALYEWAPGPVAHWNFDEGTGTSLNDISSNGHTGTFNGAPTWTTGKYGSALFFDGTDDYIDAGTAALTPNANFTVTAWIKSAANNQSAASPLNKTGVTPNTGWQFYTNAGNASFFSYDYSDDFVYTDDFVLNTWTHYTGVSTDTETCIYVNGIFIDCDTKGAGAYVESSNALRMGRRYTTSNYWKGALDDVRIYNYVRTPAQILEDMNGSPNEVTPMLHLSFDEGYGTTAYDSSSNNDSGVLSDGPTWTNAGKFGKALTLDGSNDRIMTFAPAPFEYIGADLTLSVWVKPNSADTDSGNIISKPWNGSGEYNYRLAINATDTISLVLDGAGATSTTSTTQTVTNDTWNHIVATVEGATSTVRIYLNGKLVKSGTHAITDWTPDNPDLDPSLLIGCLYPYAAPWAGNTDHCLQGDIDELKIYKALLTEDQIRLEYNRSSAVSFGSQSTASDGITADNSSSREYCVPGDTATCNPPVAEWKLDENTGTTAQDTSGGGNTGTLNNFTNPWRIGKQGSALEFDGVDDDITAGTGVDLATNGTFSAWIKPDTAGEGGYGSIITKGPAGGAGYQFYIDDNTDALAFYNGSSTTTSASVTYGAWQHVALSISNNTGTFYINGVAQDTDTTTLANTGSDTVYIGSVDGNSETFDGIIDSLRVYNYARTPAQIAWEYSRGAPAAWYKFDECQGSTAYDWAPNGNGGYRGNNGTITIGATGPNTTVGTCGGSTGEAWADGATGKIGASLEFDGTNDYVNLPNNLVKTHTQGTITAWVKFNGNGSAASVNPIVSLAGSAASGTTFALRRAEGTTCPTNTLELRVLPTPNNVICSTATLSTSVWHHVSLTADGSAYKMYINGTETPVTAPTGSNSGTWVGGITGISGVTTIADIGRIYFNGSAFSYANAHIDDVRIYNYALTANQIKTVMNNGAVSFK